MIHSRKTVLLAWLRKEGDHPCLEVELNCDSVSGHTSLEADPKIKTGLQVIY